MIIMKKYIKDNDWDIKTMEELIDRSLDDFHPDFSERIVEVQKVMGGFDEFYSPTEKFEDVCDNVKKYLLA